MVSRARHLADLIKANSTISIPTGSSGQRPSGDSGMFRLNTTNNYFEGYTTSGWSQFDGTKTFINSTVSPTNPAIGDLWLNTTNTVLSVYTTSGWIKTAAGSATNRFVDVFVANASQNTFTTSYNYSYVDVYKNNIRVPTTDFVANGISVTLNTSANANDIIEVYSFTNVGGGAIGTGGLSISSITIVNSVGTQLTNVTGFSEAGGGYVEVLGTNFLSGIIASVSGTNALNTLFISPTQLRVQVPPKSAGTYALTLTNPTGTSVTLTNSITYLTAPYWITSNRLSDVQMSLANQIQLQAPQANSFSLQFGSSLPSGLSLNQNNGLITGTLNDFSSNAYISTFTVNATSANGVTIPRTFNMFVNAAKYEAQAIPNTNTIYKYWIYENPSNHSFNLHPTGNNIVQNANNFNHIIKNRFNPPHFGVYDVLVVGGGGAAGVARTYSGGAGGGGGVAEKFNFILNSSTSVNTNKVGQIYITNGGTGYSTSPNVIITPHSSDSPTINATAISTVAVGNVVSVTITNHGLGYTQPPSIIFSGGGGSGATAEAVIGGGFAQVEVGAGGNRNHPHASNTSAQTNGCGASTTFIRNIVNNVSANGLIAPGNTFYVAVGGGRGGDSPPVSAGGEFPGKTGGSGGGSMSTPAVSGFQSSTQTGGYGNNGAGVFFEQPGSLYFAAAGGGAGAAGQTSRYVAAGGIGIQLPNWTIRGTDAFNQLVTANVRGYYGGGGSNEGASAFDQPAYSAPGGGGGVRGLPRDGLPGTGGGGAAYANGGSGICIVRQLYGYDADILLAGGGGNGGTYTIDSSNAGGGGAGGCVFTTNNQFNIIPGETYTINVGAPEANSTFTHTNYTIVALFGGRGGSSNATSNTNGSVGGSGGGKGGGTTAATSAANAVQTLYTGYGHGNDGHAGGGGGAGGIGNGSGSGGTGITWINGNTYCRGGDEGKNTGTPYPANSGGGGHGGANGSAGVCIIAYAGSQRGSGGTITSSNGYTYHTFTANGTFVG